VNAHEVKPVRLIQSLCAVCGSNLAGLTVLYIVLSCVVAVVPRLRGGCCTVLIAQFDVNPNKLRLLLLLLLLLQSLDGCVQIPVCSECMLCVHKAPEHACDRIIDIEAAQIDELKALVADSQAKVKACEDVSANLEDMLSTLQEQKDTVHARMLETFKTYAALLEKRKVLYDFMNVSLCFEYYSGIMISAF